MRQLAQRLGGYAGLAFVGMPRTIADEMEAWLEARACDGFNVMFPYLPAGLDNVVGKVIPELQRRGLFRRDYSVATIPAPRCAIPWRWRGRGIGYSRLV